MHELPIIGNSPLHLLINTFGSDCFAIVMSLSLKDDNLVQQRLPVGEVHYPPGWWGFSRLYSDRLLWYATIWPTATSSRKHISALPSAQLTVILHRARQHHRHNRISVIAAFASWFSGIFVALGFVGNGVITVMINSPWQADDDADNQSGDNRGDSAHTSISLTVPPASLNFAIRLSSLMLELTITSARQWSPDIAATVDCLTDITTINHR